MTWLQMLFTAKLFLILTIILAAAFSLLVFKNSKSRHKIVFLGIAAFILALLLELIVETVIFGSHAMMMAAIRSNLDLFFGYYVHFFLVVATILEELSKLGAILVFARYFLLDRRPTLDQCVLVGLSFGILESTVLIMQLYRYQTNPPLDFDFDLLSPLATRAATILMHGLTSGIMCGAFYFNGKKLILSFLVLLTVAWGVHLTYNEFTAQGIYPIDTDTPDDMALIISICMLAFACLMFVFKRYYMSAYGVLLKQTEPLWLDTIKK